MKMLLPKSSHFILIATIAASTCTAFAPAARAVDHNNIDAGRPLDFDDAQAIAYRERALDVGGALDVSSGGDVNAAGALEFLSGFAPNTHFSVGIDPQYGRAQNGNRRFDNGDLSVGVLHNFNREYGNVPALGARVDAFLPTGRDSSGVDFRLRGIASRQFQQYARLHLNIDLGLNNSASNGERKYLPGAIVGYSKPIGYPTSFNRTLLAQVALRANPKRGQSGIFNVGIGMRQQVTVDSVFDIGFKSDLTGGRGRSALKFIAGYSKQF